MLNRLLILFSTVLFACSAPLPTPTSPTSDIKYPSVAVAASNGQGFCGGVWIANDRILTAAHCVNHAMQAAYEKQWILGREVWRDDGLLDVAEFETNKKSQTFAKVGHVPSTGDGLTIVLADGSRIVTWVVGIDLNWKVVQLKWVAPRGASGSPAFHRNGTLACILTKQIPGKGSFCDLYQLR